ncbi:15282_t:CDS:2 [Funneliformis geosporum]|uniref:805_t:CDS:1 n=1 Tax=Funneliformis geosporum TaxID=1117311 RepID=A0A9W4WYZ4_9GLOM|nr:805_t:CDS:2 [Funneliformis geosporum]CAI2188510.1 15282_t:CDS:2 [Funneliformis geosporum]
MPNKRKRKRGTEKDQSKYDASPVSDKISDIPRNFKRLLQANEFKKNKIVETSRIKSKQTIQRMPGESFRNFSRRLEDHMRPDIIKAMKVGMSTKDKAKRYREKLKEKKKAKIEKLIEEVNAKDFNDFQDKVKFGEVVQAPPSLTVIPKHRGKILKKDSLEKEREQKNKQLNAVNKRIMDKERERVMTQYRIIKARKLMNKNHYSKD